MKLQLFYVLLFSLLNISKCQNIINILTPTNYTMDYLETLSINNVPCETDNDCPEFSRCKEIHFSMINKSIPVCKFDDIICREKAINNLDKEEKCFRVDPTLYNMDKEEIINSLSEINEPILKTCPPVELSESCARQNCFSDSDCLSEQCSSVCVAKDTVTLYRCTFNEINAESYRIECKKTNGMKCSTDSDCYSGKCQSYSNCSSDDTTTDNKDCTESFYCANNELMDGEKKFKIPFSLLIILLVILVLVFVCIGFVMFSTCREV